MVYDVGEGQGVSVQSTTNKFQIGDIVRYMRTNDYGIILALIHPLSSQEGINMWYKVEWFGYNHISTEEDWLLNKVTPNV